MLEEKYYVYWLHELVHTDILTEGYIGITKNPIIRFRTHKYKDLISAIIDEGSKQYCRTIEHKLRPEANIGLNKNPGGMIPIMTKRRREVARNRMLTDNPMKKPGSVEKNSGCFRIGHQSNNGKKRPDLSERNKKISYTREKTYEEIYGIKKAKQLREMRSQSNKKRRAKI